MTEINGLDERISELKILYQEAERINLKDKAIELLVDINYLEELRELRRKQEPCEDAVSVTSVFEIMGNLLSIPYDFGRSITEKDVSESMDKIRELPRVTPQETRKGHWIDIKNKNGTVIATRCSRCGNSPKHAIKSDFCPNCGADMREVSELKNGNVY